MKLWLISQIANGGYDTYDSAVVAAETEEDARRTHPAGEPGYGDKNWPEAVGEFTSWALPEHVTAKLIGEAAPDVAAGVICASFNAG